jgi:transcriptional regulator with XRE-family HTH domain
VESVRVSAELPAHKSVLGSWLLERREACGMSQQQAAQAMSVDSREIRRWEKGEVPGGVTLIRLMSTYGVQMEPRPPLPDAVNVEIATTREELERRLATLEATVEAQGKAATRALRALAKEVRALAPPQDQAAPSATRKQATQ